MRAFSDPFVLLKQFREAAVADCSSAVADARKGDFSASSNTYENRSNCSNCSSPPRENALATVAPRELEDKKDFFNNNNNFQALSEVELGETELSLCEQAIAPATVATPATLELNHCNRSTIEAIAPATVAATACYSSAADVWRQSFSLLSPRWCPVEGYREWSKVYGNIRRFLDSHAETAAAHGWDEVELFGVHPELGVRQVRHCGLLLLTVCKPVTSVDPDRITTANGLVWRRGSIAAGSVSIFDMTKLHAATQETTG